MSAWATQMSFDAILPIVLLLIVLIAYTAHTIYIYRLACASSEWPVTEGLVLNGSLYYFLPVA